MNVRKCERNLSTHFCYLQYSFLILVLFVFETDVSYVSTFLGKRKSQANYPWRWKSNRQGKKLQNEQLQVLMVSVTRAVNDDTLQVNTRSMIYLNHLGQMILEYRSIMSTLI